MKIANYNKQDHDIYVFDESQMVLLGELPPNPQEFAGLCPGGSQPPSPSLRRHAPVLGYNYAGLWNQVESLGITSVPDWSGLGVRGRGSTLNTCASPHSNYLYDYALYSESAPYSDALDYNNWNSGSPPYTLISPKHIVGCNHFSGAQTTIQVTFLGKNGVFYTKNAQKISDYSDASLYRIDLPFTEEELNYVKAYQIVRPSTIPGGVHLWRPTPNGMFNLYVTPPQGGAVFTKPYEYSKVDSRFPSAYSNIPGEGSQNIWTGDSGTQLLLTYQGETYLVGALDFFVFLGQPNVWDWLESLVRADGIYLQYKAIPTDSAFVQEFLARTSAKYGAGFLEESQGAGLPFNQMAAAGNPPLAAAKVSGDLPGSQVSLSHVLVDASAPGRSLSCNVMAGATQLFSRYDFIDSYDPTNPPSDTTGRLPLLEKTVGDYIHGLLADSARGMYFSYVLPIGAVFSSEPADSYPLALFCVDPHAGSVDLFVESQRLDPQQVNLLPGYNYELAYSADDPLSVTFSVSPGAGDGLEPCEGGTAVDDVVRRINGKEANSRGEFSIQAPPAECLTVDSRYIDGHGTVRLESHCAPCCRCKDYSDSSAYIKSVAVAYNEAVRRLDELTALYNSVARAFQARIQCCDTFGGFTPRFRMWPQQNFKLQIQAMAENNTSGSIRVNSMKLVTAITAKHDMSAQDENGQTYSISAGQSLAAIPISDASYLYFKSLNPTSQGINFRIAGQGVVETTVDMTSLPLPSCSTAGDHPRDVPPCTGYTMVTAGLVVVDPVFRKIVNLNGQDVQLDARLDFTYFGSPVGQPPCDAASEQVIASGVVKPVKISPNKKSVNPCPAPKASYLSVGSDLSLALKFSDPVSGSGNVQLVYKSLVEGTWTEVYSTSAAVSATLQSEVSLGQVPSQLQGVLQVTAVFSGQPSALVSKCKAVDASDDEVDIPVGDFTLVASLVA